MCFTHHKDLAWMIEIFFLFKYILSASRPSWLHVFCFLFWRLGLCYDIIYIKSQFWLTLISSFNSFCEHNAHQHLWTQCEPTLVVGIVATNTSMVVSSIPDNGERGEHHSDPVYLGESQKPEVSEVNLCKQEEDIAGEVAAHMTPPLETRHAPTLQDKSGFHPEESMVEDILGKG